MMTVIIILVADRDMDPLLERRLQLIEMYLFFWGQVQRKDLCRHFEIGAVTASRILKVYIESHPENIHFDVTKRAYIKSRAFIPQYSLDAEAALNLLAYGVESRNLDNRRYGPAKITSFTAPLIIEHVAAITRAMNNSNGSEIRYISASGVKQRTVYPHAIFQAGAAWYFRAYDSDHMEFRTFRFSRLAGVLNEKPALDEAQARKDTEWNSDVILTLSPHERHPSREALAMDLGLEGKPVTNHPVKSALAGFVLTDLRVDCSDGSNLDPYEYPLQLQNRSELLNVDSMIIAPGFSK